MVLTTMFPFFMFLLFFPISPAMTVFAIGSIGRPKEHSSLNGKALAKRSTQTLCKNGTSMLICSLNRRGAFNY